MQYFLLALAAIASATALTLTSPVNDATWADSTGNVVSWDISKADGNAIQLPSLIIKSSPAAVGSEQELAQNLGAKGSIDFPADTIKIRSATGRYTIQVVNPSDWTQAYLSSDVTINFPPIIPGQEIVTPTPTEIAPRPAPEHVAELVAVGSSATAPRTMGSAVLFGAIGLALMM